MRKRKELAGKKPGGIVFPMENLIAGLEGRSSSERQRKMKL